MITVELFLICMLITLAGGILAGRQQGKEKCTKQNNNS